MTRMTLKDKIDQTNDFLVGVELVSTRGTMSEKRAIQAKEFSSALTYHPQIDWVSITDNAGGNPMLSPEALGTPILFGGQNVMIHMSCKDLNRHGLESRAWALASHGFHNILALTGDYPIQDTGGMPKPVFDLDSVGLLGLLERMNKGLEIQSHSLKRRQLLPTTFFLGAVTTNFKLHEQSVVPQYLKLTKKVQNGARFIINQIGYDSLKMQELITYLQHTPAGHIPVFGNVFVLNVGVARLFHKQRIPGVVISPKLLEICEKQAATSDKGKRFFLEFAAKQLCIYKGLGYRGVYLGGVHATHDIEEIFTIAQSFSPNDWHIFSQELQFSRPNEFYLPAPTTTPKLPYKQTITYAISKKIHKWFFAKNTQIAKLAKRWCQKHPLPRPLRLLEHMSKSLLFHCKDCGDCSLHEIAFLCPESQCAKNQRNGPCGGSRDLLCEVTDTECIWSRAYMRLKTDGKEKDLLNHVPVLQNQALRGTSSWANHWLGKDHSQDHKEPENGTI